MYNYYITDIDNVTPELWEKVNQMEETARQSLDGTKVILSSPDLIEGLDVITWKEILAIASNSEWYESDGLP